jgi:signal peptidase II
MNKYLLLLITLLLGISLDQWTKHLVHAKFYWGQSVAIIADFFSLTYVRNSGAAFGLMHRAPAWFRDPFFLIVPSLALIIISVIFHKLRKEQKLTAFALSLILSGAIGNLIDRVRFGFVIDFLDFHWKNSYHFPAFNVADSCVVVGVALLFIQSLLDERASRQLGAKLKA